MSSQAHPSRLISAKQLTKDVWLYSFSRPPGFDFIPGQHLRLILDYPHTLPGENTRLLSIASSPLEKDHLLLAVKISSSSFKTALLNLRPGSSVEIIGPMGSFILKPAFRLMFISGGIGLAPFYGLIRHIHFSRLPVSVLLASSFKTSSDQLFTGELESFVAQGWLTYYRHITQQQVRPPLLSGRIGLNVLRGYLNRFSPQLIYLCGAIDMVETVKDHLLALNIDPSMIFTEKFAAA